MKTLRMILALGCCGGGVRGAESAPLRWLDASTLPIEGKGWTATAHPFDRLPSKAKGVVRGPVYSLGGDSAGLALHFVTDTASLSVRWTLRRERLAMSHFAATGVSGLDLYIKIDGGWRWTAVARPEKAGTNESVLFAQQGSQSREFMLYLPLYNGVEHLELGLAPGAQLVGAEPDRSPPIVFYGTSVVQGGCASRPGMAYPALIGRRLHRPTINLGFSGNGKAEPEMADLLAELTPAAFVIDTLGNLQPEEVARVEQFVGQLRARHPTTPIVLIENIDYPDGVFIRERREQCRASNRKLNEIFERLRPSDQNLYRVPAEGLIGSDNEATVDGSHPTDLGFTRIADALTPLLQRVIPSR